MLGTGKTNRSREDGLKIHFSENVAIVKKALQKRLSVHSEGHQKLYKVSTTFESESLKKQLSKCQFHLEWKISFWQDFRPRMAEQRPRGFDIYLLVF